MKCEFCEAIPFEQVGLPPGDDNSTRSKALFSARRPYRELNYSCNLCLEIDKCIQNAAAHKSIHLPRALVQYSIAFPNQIGCASEFRVGLFVSKSGRPVESAEKPGSHISLDIDLIFRVYKSVPHQLLEPVDFDSGTPAPGGCVRKVDSRVDFDLLRQWDEACMENGHSCHNLPHFAKYDRSSVRIRLVDVQRKCLVETTLEEPFVALSYVWGNLKPDGLTFEKVGNEIKKYYKVASLDGLHLPRAIEDAFEVTRQLGYRLLFVDRLCINQDDPVDVDTYVGRMSQIYGLAALTIVASGAAASSGLPGVGSTFRHIMQRRTFSVADGQELAEISESELQPQNLVEDRLLATPWSTRGWTYQERLLSPRLLIFTSEGAMWSCWQGRYCEQISYESVVVQPTADSAGSDLRLDESLSRLTGRDKEISVSKKYAALVTSYRKRALTYRFDMLRAFQGILSTFSEINGPWPFCFALSTKILPLELAWGIAPDDEHPTGAAEDSEWEDFDATDEFPTWSWLASKGEVMWDHGLHYCTSSIVAGPTAMTGSIFRVKNDHCETRPLPPEALELLYEETRPRARVRYDEAPVDEAVVDDREALLTRLPSRLLENKERLSHALIFNAFTAPCKLQFVTSKYNPSSRQVVLKFSYQKHRVGLSERQAQIAKASNVVLQGELAWQQYPSLNCATDKKESLAVLALGRDEASGRAFRRVHCLLVSRDEDGVMYREGKFSCSTDNFAEIMGALKFETVVLC